MDPAWVQVGVSVVTVVFGGGIAFREYRDAQTHAKTDRTIQMHRDLTTGEIGAARDRFTEVMWRHGSSVALGRCHQPTFGELLPPRFTNDESAELWRYPEDMGAPPDATPMQDLYKVLWAYERIEAARSKGRLDDELLASLVGFHAVWWNELLSRVTLEDTSHRSHLESLRTAMCKSDSSLISRAERDFSPS